jgi:hypothetical protein
MRLLRRMGRRLAGLFADARQDAELADEIESHLEMLTEANLRRGMTPEEARRQAMLTFGGIESTRESYRDQRGVPWLEALSKDVRYAVRGMRKRPAFTAVAVLSLALGIGANTAIFSVMDVMLLRALPVKDAEHLVEFIRLHPRGAMMGNLPCAVFSYFQQDRRVLADVFAIESDQPVFRAGGASERVSAHLVSGSFFPALGVPALAGRTFGHDADAAETNHVAVMSHAFWSRRFGQDPAILGSTVRIADSPFTVVGVMPPEFCGVDRSKRPDMWIPLSTQAQAGEVWVFGHVKPGVTIEQARAALQPLFQQALESLRGKFRQSPEQERAAFLAQKLLVNRATNGSADLRWSYWQYSYTLKILVALAGLVLLITCANLANLLMARSAARSREFSIRLAIGAGRWRLVRQLMTENLLLSLALGAIATYGAVAYGVASRTSEIGLRMALGAQRGDVLWLMMRESLLPLWLGIIMGLPAAWWVTRLIRKLLFGLTPSDPVAIAAALAALAAAGILASLVPARRAASATAMAPLRSE